MIKTDYPMLGNEALVKQRGKIAFLSSRKMTPDGVMGSHAWAERVRNEGNCIISGFQSDQEKTVLQFLLRGTCPIIWVRSRRLPKTIPANLREAAAAGRILLISLAGAKQNRAGEPEAIRRNRFVLENASSYVFGSLDPDGTLAKLAADLPKSKITVLG